MLKKILATALLAILMVTSATAVDFDQSYYFRYKLAAISSPPEEEGESKDITAFFVGAVGKTFLEKLPLKAQWLDDNWEVTKGTLPPGISFNNQTMEFAGEPTVAGVGTVVELTGSDANGDPVADAQVTFSMYELVGVQPKVNFYAHTGKYTLRQLALPDGVAVANWTYDRPAPPGIEMKKGRNFDGTPTMAGNYPILIRGHDYLGKQIIAYFGNFIVEDAPTFAYTIPDQVVPLNGALQQTMITSPSASSVLSYSVGDPANPTDKTNVRYVLEYDSQGALFDGLRKYPLKTNDLWVSGVATSYYQSVKLRYKAIDSDGMTGYSNWFALGTLGPSAECKPVPNQTSILVNMQALVPYDGTTIPLYTDGYGTVQGSRIYSITSGSLPGGITMDTATGAFKGTPIKEQQLQGTTLNVAVTNKGITDNFECGPYDFSVVPAMVTLKVDSGPLKGHVRVNKPFTGTITAGPPLALVEPYAITLDDGQVLPAGLSTVYSNGVMTVSGTPTVSGDHNLQFTFKNGDGVVRKATLNVEVHDELKIDPILADVSIKQYDVSDNLMTVTYDAAAIVPEGPQPSLTLEGSAPYGFDFNTPLTWSGLVAYSNDTLLGGTKMPEGKYGPFRYKLVDAYNQPIYSSYFYITVTKRDPMRMETTMNPVEFYLGTGVQSPQSQLPLAVWQPPLAADLDVQYTISPADMPTDLAFNPDSGEISGFPSEEARGIHGPYVITATDAEQYQVASDPFMIDLKDPPPISAQSIALQQGNVNVTFKMDGKPTFDPLTLVGNQDEGTFVRVDNPPPGLGMNSDGTFSGIPTAVFNDTTTVTFKDKANREGTLDIRFIIHPELNVYTDKSEYTVGRLVDASIVPTTVGFYNGATFALAPTSAKLPRSMSVNKISGSISGRSPDAVDTPFPGIVIRATHTGSAEFRDTPPFAIKIGPQEEFKIEYTDRIIYKLSQATLKLADPVVGNGLPKLSGSYTLPIEYSASGLPQGVDMDSATGKLTGAPTSVGDWTVTATPKDAENRVASPETFEVRGTLAGYIETSPGSQSRIVRQGESFQTSVQTPSNFVGKVVYGLLNAPPPDTLDFNTVTGKLEGYLTDIGSHVWRLQATDDHDRTILGATSPRFDIAVIAPVAKPGVTSVVGGEQYSPDKPLFIRFSPAKFIMGKASYVVLGDLPGKLYYKFYANDNPTGLATYIHYDENGQAETITQLSTESASDTEARLSLDHLVFDTLKLTLKGIPSKYGQFDNLTIAVSDDHQNNYWKTSDATRFENNSATSDPFSISVAKADDLEIANTLEAETLYRYTSAPTLKTVIKYAAYGVTPKWDRLEGTLPQNVTAGPSTADTLAYAGYPEQLGTYDNIVYRATDAAGRSINANPVSLTVEPRGPFQMVASSNPKGMIVFATDAAMTVTPKNSPYGRAIPDASWSVSGADHLPPGVNFAIADGKVFFSGTSHVIGTYSGIAVSATDSLGATASVSLTFKVISNSDPIILEVENIKTKPGFAFTSALPLTGNTYGAIRFYSYDLATYPQISLNPATGVIDGTFTTTQMIDFDLFVTDETNRLTSKPMTIEVMPFLDIIVPSQVLVNQGEALNRTVDTFYAIGAVTYREGSGNWPDGIDVDPETGTITGYVDQEPKEYPGLTIVGNDTFGDEQSSNVFSIKIDPTMALPDIIDPTQSKVAFGTVGTASSYTPTVKVYASQPYKAWTFKGTTFEINHDLTQYGLSFDQTTGTISGTPTAPVLIKDMVMTVTSPRGETDSTAPFWFYIVPSQEVAFVAAPSAFKVHAGVEKEDIPVNAQYALGDVTYRIASSSGVARTVTLDQLAATMNIVANTEGAVVVNVMATDEVGRTASKRFDIESVNVTVAYTPVNAESGMDYTGSLPTVSEAFGEVSYSFEGLPSGLTFDPVTGLVTGKTDVDANLYPVTVTATDLSDDAKGSITVGMYVLGGPAHKYWKVVITTSTQSTQRFNLVGKMHMYDVAGAVLTSPSTVTVTSSTPGTPANLISSNTNYFYICAILSCNVAQNPITSQITYTFSSKVRVYKVIANGSDNLITSATGYPMMRATLGQLFYSDDGQTWIEQSVDATRTYSTNTGRPYTYTLTKND